MFSNFSITVFVLLFFIPNTTSFADEVTQDIFSVDAGKDIISSSNKLINLNGKSNIPLSKITTLSWQQVSGKNVNLTTPSSPNASFIAPIVDQVELLSFKLTITDDEGLIKADTANVHVLPMNGIISNDVLLFTQERIDHIRFKITQNNEAWLALEAKISKYFEKTPYNAGEYAGAFALAFYITREDRYMKRAIELLNHAYFSVPDIGWEYYDSRNQFRINARWAIMGYTWIKDYISQNEKIRIENILKLWSDYWVKHVDYQNNFESLRIADSDNVTSLTKNITLLGYALSYSTQFQEFGNDMLTIADELLEKFVVNYYMNDVMAGGAWAEGSDYSPATQIHWIETFLINKDQRGIAYPNNYATLATKVLIHTTLAGDTGIYKYGSEEGASDYEELNEDYRYEFALNLMSILENDSDVQLINQWFNKVVIKEGFATGSMVTGLERLLYHDPLKVSLTEVINEPTLNLSEGIGLISSRSSWEDDATNLYFINRSVRLDHEHQDALSFDVAFKGKWVTKERTGYSGEATKSLAHNTILIENASSDGSSSPTRRPVGPPTTALFNDEHITLISADATDTYNMSGYFATSYAKQVNRQIAYIKPNTVIVYDHIDTDKTAIKDLVKYSDHELQEGMDYTRWVKIIQHLQAEPSKVDDNNNFSVITKDYHLSYQVLFPQNAKVEVIDERALWEGAREYEMPENQRKWHLQVTEEKRSEHNEFITSLNFGSLSENENYLLNPFIMTKNNGYILNGESIGAAIYINDEAYIILFSQKTDSELPQVKFIKPEGFEDAKVYDFNLMNNE